MLSDSTTLSWYTLLTTVIIIVITLTQIDPSQIFDFTRAVRYDRYYH